MTRQEQQKPSAGWWRDDRVTVEKFFREIERLQAMQYTAGDVQFTDDVLVTDLMVGEAGQVERIGRGMRVGFFRIGPSGIRYGLIDEGFTVRPKRC